jgi:hypothetical protein
MKTLPKALSLAGTTLGVFAFSSLLTVQKALAVPTVFDPTASTEPVTETGSVISNVGDTILTVLAFLAGLAAVVYLVWGGIKYITAGGDPKKAEEARKAIINAVIGIIIVAAAYFIISFAIGGGSFVQGLSNGGLTIE